MKIADAIYTSGLILGMIIGTLLLGKIGVTGIWQLLGGLVTGVGLGYMVESVYNSSVLDE